MRKHDRETHVIQCTKETDDPLIMSLKMLAFRMAKLQSTTQHMSF